MHKTLACFNAYCVGPDLHRNEKACARGSETVDQSEDEGGMKSVPKQQNCLCRVSRIRKEMVLSLFG